MTEQHLLHAHNKAKPQHIAIIMDGNGRWAKESERRRSFGHQQGMNATKATITACLKYQIPILTLFAFSSENWARPAPEVKWLMRLLYRGLKRELTKLNENRVKIQFIGRRDRLDGALINQIQHAEHSTRDNTRLLCQIAVDYGGRWDIIRATQKLAKEVALGYLKADEITEALFCKTLSTAACPDPDLFIRTGGECRMSNFLLWQCAYSEYYFADCYWPDFNEIEFLKSLESYRLRQRRFGLTDEQQGAIHA